MAASKPSSRDKRAILATISRTVFDASSWAFWWTVSRLPDGVGVRLAYLKNFGRLPDLASPKTFNEKLNWRKLHQRDPRHVIYSDKVAVKERIASLIGPDHVLPNLWVGERPEEIPFDRLEPPYVIKTNHACGNHIFVRFKSDVQRDKIIGYLRRQLAYDYSSKYKEWAYRHIDRKVLVEPMIPGTEASLPDDYKFFVYHGKALFVQHNTNRSYKLKVTFYDRDWRKLPAKLGWYDTEPGDVERPSHYDLMISMADRIGSQFDFARIDFYQTPQSVLFGEATFFPNAGMVPFAPAAWDLRFGEPWQLPD